MSFCKEAKSTTFLSTFSITPNVTATCVILPALSITLENDGYMFGGGLIHIENGYVYHI